jgi:general secretion pathway protein G
MQGLVAESKGGERTGARRRRSARRVRAGAGFTLVEVLLVILILGMLFGVLIVAIMPAREKARSDTTKLLLDQVENAMERYQMDIGHYPTEEEGGLNALLTKPSFEDEKTGQNWSGPYLKQEPRDSWQRPLHYERVEAAEPGAKPFHIWSSGADGQDGTADDIRNWQEATS